MKTKEVLRQFGGYGRFTVDCLETGHRVYCEPIAPNVKYTGNWGDEDPVTGKLTGSYNGKSRGAIVASESLITEENGFTKIEIIEGGSPFYAIEQRFDEYKRLARLS